MSPPPDRRRVDLLLLLALASVVRCAADPSGSDRFDVEVGASAGAPASEPEAEA